MKKLIVVVALATAALATAKSPVDPVNKDKAGLAVKGYDPVGYFKANQPVKGSPEYTFDWNGAKWQFLSAENRDSFAASPEKYAPQFGGFCAWAVGHNYTADTDPEAWKIVNGKLYLNYSKDIQKKWDPEKDKWIPSGERNWPALHK
jgi:hypothetical protein